MIGRHSMTGSLRIDDRTTNAPDLPLSVPGTFAASPCVSRPCSRADLRRLSAADEYLTFAPNEAGAVRLDAPQRHVRGVSIQVVRLAMGRGEESRWRSARRQRRGRSPSAAPSRGGTLRTSQSRGTTRRTPAWRRPWRHGPNGSPSNRSLSCPRSAVLIPAPLRVTGRSNTAALGTAIRCRCPPPQSTLQTMVDPFA